jgi:hypothetical protein
MEGEVCEEKKEKDIVQPKLGIFWNLSKMIVTLKLKTQLLFMKIHTFQSRAGEI